MFPVKCVSCFTLPVAFDHRKICCCPGLSVFEVQVEKNASVVLSGDQTGELLEQSVAAPTGAINCSFEGSGSTADVTCSVVMSPALSVHATTVPSGDSATPPGWASFCALPG
jgi:hypothetical protein